MNLSKIHVSIFLYLLNLLVIADPCKDQNVIETLPLENSTEAQVESLLEKINKDQIMPINKIPWIGRLISGNEDFACTAILVTKELVLTAAHCEEKLKDAHFKWRQVGHLYKEKHNVSLHFKPKKVGLLGDDWILYRLDQKIETNSLPNIVPSKSIDLENGTLISVGYPKDGHSIYKVSTCSYVGEGYNSKSFVTDCYSKEGMSGGPVLYIDSKGELFLVGIRSGPQSGIFIKDGTREIRSERFLPYIKDGSI